MKILKIFADYQLAENDYKRISRWDINDSYKNYISTTNQNITIQKYYQITYKNKLYSTHRDFNRKQPLALTIKDPFYNSFFKYVGGSRHSSSEESISHELYKEIIANLKILNLKINKQMIKLYITKSEIEYKFTANSNTYFADVFFWFNKSEPEEYTIKWGGIICFEIKYTHATEKQKILDCQLSNIPIFEHSISKKLRVDGDIKNKEEEIEAQNFIRNYMEKEIFGKLLSDPETEVYKQIKNLKREKIELNNTITSNQSIISNLNREIDNLNREIDNLKATNNKLKNENQKMCNILKRINQHSILKLLLKLFKIEFDE